MAIQTHASLRAGSITDSGVMTPANSCGPSTKHFFPCNEGSGNTITDVSKHGSATAVVLTSGGATWSDSNRRVDMAVVAATAITAGNWVDLGTNDAILFAVGDPFDGGVPNFHGFMLGNSASTKSAILVAENSAQVDDGTTLIQSTGGTTITDSTGTVGIASVVDRTANTVQRICYGNLAESDTAVDLGAITGSITPDDEFNTFGFRLYGVALFSFANGIPSDYATALQWMYTNWIAGNKYIYPGWSSI